MTEINPENYPRFFAIPFNSSLNREDAQRKEYQRIALENLLAFNAVICMSCHTAHNQELDEKKAEGSSTESITYLKNLSLDLTQMSMGRWNQVARDASKFLVENRVWGKEFYHPIYELYHGQHKGNWNKWVNELISRRNQDAHGAMSSAEALQQELEERQELLSGVFGLCSFYKDHRVITPLSEEYRDGQIVHVVRTFQGLEERAQSLGGPLEGDLNEGLPYLILNSRLPLPLHPFMICRSYEGATSLFLYSKTLNRKSGDLHYIGLNKSLDLDAANDDSESQTLSSKAICEDFSGCRVKLESEELLAQIKPSLLVERVFRFPGERQTIQKNDEIEMLLTVKNTGDASANDASIVFPLPAGFTPDQSSMGFQAGDLFEFPFDTIPIGRSLSQAVTLKANEAGLREFPQGAITYNYTDAKGEEVQVSPDSEGAGPLPSLYLEVIDPEDPDSLLPIVNLRLDYSENNPKVGTAFDLRITVENVGKSVAKEVDVHLFPPTDRVALVSGDTQWRGSLNPQQSITIPFTLLPRQSGIFSMRMRDIHYKNLDGDEFKTLAYEDHKVLIQNDKEAFYRFKMEEFWDDLHLDPPEQDELDAIHQREPYSEIPPETRERLQMESQLKVIRTLIQNEGEKRNAKFREFSGSPRGAEYKKDQWFCFSLQRIPVVMLRVQPDANSIKFYFRDDTGAESLTWRKEFRQVLFKTVDFKEISGGRGAGDLKKYVNQTLSQILNRDVFLVKCVDILSSSLNLKKESLFYPTRQEGKLFCTEVRFSENDESSENASEQSDDEFISTDDNPYIIDELIFTMDNQNATLILSYPQKLKISNELLGLGYKLLEKPDGNEVKEASSARVTFAAIPKGVLSAPVKSLPEEKISSEFSQFVKDCHQVIFESNLGQLKNKRLNDLFLETQAYLKDKSRGFLVRFSGSCADFFTDDFPAFSGVNHFLKIEWTQNKVFIKVKYLEYSNWVDLEKRNRIRDGVLFRLDYRSEWCYSIVITLSQKQGDFIDSSIGSAISIALSTAGRERQDPSFGVMFEMLDRDESWRTLFAKLLDGPLSYQDCDNIIESVSGKQDLKRGRPITQKLRGATTSFNNRKMETPIEASGTDMEVSIKDRFRGLIHQVVENFDEVKQRAEQDAEEEENATLSGQSATPEDTTEGPAPTTPTDEQEVQESSGVRAPAPPEEEDEEVGSVAGGVESSVADENQGGYPPYTQASLQIVDSQRNLLEVPDEEMRAIVMQVLDQESPLHEDVLVWRICAAAGVKAGSRIVEAVIQGAQLAEARGELIRNGKFFFRQGMRVTPKDRAEVDHRERNIDYISGTEMGVALIALIKQQVRMSKQNAAKEVLRRFGFGRVTEDMLLRFQKVTSSLVNKGSLVELDDELKLPMSESP